jgi:hypothetical protein
MKKTWKTFRSLPLIAQLLILKSLVVGAKWFKLYTYCLGVAVKALLQ